MNNLQGKADLHIHTNHSDGNNSVEEVLTYIATHTDLKLIAITDHDTISGALKAQQLAGSFGVEVIVGEEISTADGHMLALFIEQTVPPGLSAAASIAAVHEQGGVCIPAHPYGQLVPSMGRRGLRRRAAGPDCEWPVDGIEGLNASLWRPYNNILATRVAAELDVACCGGSDSHHLSTIGSAYTVFPGRTAQDLWQAIRQRQTCAEGAFWGWNEVATAALPWFKRELRSLTQLFVPRTA
ncbi:MAG: PHP domain-containing protein [Chloroflexi bacterium AL-W]|nr:PHP domain-containing protein [Chloroflexi bacterium AL-N1]NOK65515.1 PHP domain-containing protein [Chloroflexi bacterium AL-N10]NOK74543.1 PHP domain-containing protein [Chloroflexi bacterium AL-N5]NOK80549.1 PHP domain-containing protein [Chloroflexi bacterium AL-W]NOK88801.1 PHP domain-containing protein [Chloroflexi bacterium AL-N15]